MHSLTNRLSRISWRPVPSVPAKSSQIDARARSGTQLITADAISFDRRCQIRLSAYDDITNMTSATQRAKVNSILRARANNPEVRDLDPGAGVPRNEVMARGRACTWSCRSPGMLVRPSEAPSPAGSPPRPAVICIVVSRSTWTTCVLRSHCGWRSLWGSSLAESGAWKPEPPTTVGREAGGN